MEGHLQLVSFIRPVAQVEFPFQYLLYGFVIISSIAKGPLAGFYQAIVAHFFRKTQYAHAGFICLLRVLLAVQYFQYIKPYIFMDAGGPGCKPLRRPLTYKAVCRSHMIFLCCILVSTFSAIVQRNAFVVIINFHAETRVQKLYFFTNKSIGNTVIMLVGAESNMTVFRDRCVLVFFQFIT